MGEASCFRGAHEENEYTLVWDNLSCFAEDDVLQSELVGFKLLQGHQKVYFVVGNWIQRSTVSYLQLKKYWGIKKETNE